MQIIEYFTSADPSWIAKIEACEWSAAKFLAKILKTDTFHENLGHDAELYILSDDGRLTAFCTLSPRDCIADESLTPWIGFVFTAPEYRGHRYSGQLIAYAEHIARKKNYGRTYLGTDEIGLYEKYGYTYLDTRPDVHGGQSRVYYKNLKEKS